MSAKDYIKSIIRIQGSISIAQYMAIALGDSRYGYYTNHLPFGKDGDFITAPEISQTFGELIGAWCASLWQEKYNGEKAAILELGPGKGTLMLDFLSATKRVENFHNNIAVTLIEISPLLKKIQQDTLSKFAKLLNITWQETLSPLPKCPTFFIANEFFDALPIHQFVHTENGWREIMITIDSKTDDLTFTLSPTETTNCGLIPKDLRKKKVGAIVEVCPAAIAFTKEISQHINNYGGAALFIDYGYAKNPLKSSLQSLRQHKSLNVLEAPGQADITAHVDFSIIKNTAKSSSSDIRVYGPITQSDFLNTLGINIRADILTKKLDRDRRENILSGVKRLTDKEQMGELFKCLAIAHKNLPTPAGFVDDSLSKSQ